MRPVLSWAGISPTRTGGPKPKHMFNLGRIYGSPMTLSPPWVLLANKLKVHQGRPPRVSPAHPAVPGLSARRLRVTGPVSSSVPVFSHAHILPSEHETRNGLCVPTIPMPRGDRDRPNTSPRCVDDLPGLYFRIRLWVCVGVGVLTRRELTC